MIAVNSNKKTDLKIIDAFCGAGGLSLGFAMAGFKVAYAFDNDEPSIITHKKNLGDHAFLEDAFEVGKKRIKQQVQDLVDTVDVVCGGPPCQGFSVQRRGSDTDVRNQLVPEFIRLVMEIRPRFFVMENVAGLLSKRGLPFYEHISKECMDEGYYLHKAKLNANDFGVPQNRIRVFLIGEQLSGSSAKFEFPEREDVDWEGKTTVREAIEDLQDKPELYLPNHRSDKLSPINVERIKAVKPGQGRESLPEHLQLKTHKKNKTHRHVDVYGRMAWDKPAPTITARFDSFTRGQFGHPKRHRTITLREGARLQSFPDDFEFIGTKVQVARQIGNAVPPLLARAVAKKIKQCLEG